MKTLQDYMTGEQNDKGCLLFLNKGFLSNFKKIH